jgi:hypothetical protein
MQFARFGLGDAGSKEWVMQRSSLAGLVTTAFIAVAAMAPGQARAVPLALAPGSLAAVDVVNATEQVRYVCRPVRRCNRWGCRWRERCFWRRSYRGPSVGFYFGPRPYYHRPYRRHHRRW